MTKVYWCLTNIFKYIKLGKINCHIYDINFPVKKNSVVLNEILHSEIIFCMSNVHNVTTALKVMFSDTQL